MTEPNDVRPILDALAAAVPAIRRELRGPADETSAGSTDETGIENASGDAQLAADRRIDRLLEDRLTPLAPVGAYASEERGDVLDVGDGYALAVDPLDGSSNLRSNTPVGTIVGVYDASLPARGRHLVASAFLLYGPTTTMTVAVDGEVTRYAVEGGETVSAEPVTFPETSEICGFSGRTDDWEPAVREFWRELRRTHKLRYTGAMVGDVAHLLDRGGLVGYPRSSARPEGVLRLQYESNPIAHLVEAAGGRTSSGRGSILEVEPSALHERLPAYFGNREHVERLESSAGE